MNQKRTRIPLPHPKPVDNRSGAWLLLVVGTVLLLLSGLLAWTLAGALVDGQIVTGNRAGPRHLYSLALQPTQFYGELLWQGLTTLLLGALAAAALWIGRSLMVADRPRR
ncbi:hypothetical protein [Pseudomonas piscis]|uniref:Type VI secretion protein n=1 Tax=Pseudomonas piscis TaxID=2614538 RepID=U7A1M7_9PSED|nr:hypothetical protein [Pseudomonas piscis]ERO65603.1 hypothetical protein P308_01855 [Pseudomonas piscis]MCU7648622.1 hypothetical protein [Pseudomonas piscis]MQA56201.1 hypothetical protein [Pseudomonas piscis]WMN18168.1 hypothetical protein QL104_01820 [Pseudomonas piscis]